MLNLSTLPNIMQSSFDKLYEYSTQGCLGFSSAQALAESYLEAYPHPDKAIDMLIQNESIKAASSGFITNLGGLILLPVTLPANLFGLLLLQLRLILAIAIIYRIDVSESRIKTYFYLLLCGQAGKTLAEDYLKKYFLSPKASLSQMTSIHLGKLLLMQISVKNTSKLLRMLPFVSGVIGGAVDGGMTYKMAYYAKKQLYQVLS